MKCFFHCVKQAEKGLCEIDRIRKSGPSVRQDVKKAAGVLLPAAFHALSDLRSGTDKILISYVDNTVHLIIAVKIKSYIIVRPDANILTPRFQRILDIACLPQS